MIRAELWTEFGVRYDHWFVTENLICITAFLVDVLVGQGLAVRRWDEDCGDYRYCDAAYALVDAVVN